MHHALGKCMLGKGYVMGEPPLRICAIGDEATVLFAADELRTYLKRVTNRQVVLDQSEAGGASESICVGLMDAFPEVAAPTVADARFDDAIAINVRAGQGVIAGINPRSVLLAVYRYLTELGCRWVRPDADGAYVPSLDALPDVSLAETPSYRHRAVCIEGAVSYEHVRDMIAWLPKLGLNGYFVQFREAHTFFDRWYSRVGSPNEKTDRLSKEQAVEYTAMLEAEIKKRGLLYHKVGHGWTCEPFGVSGLGWGKEEAEPGPEVAQYFAEINGKRKLWGGVALNTNLCYSNPEVRRTMVEAIAGYAEEYPNVDFLHVWLADGSNNNCECDACQKARPADFYVAMLNELDAFMTEKGIETKIVFLVYVDLLWPPERERVLNPNRFVLMFAPIVRTYSETFRAGDDLPELPPFVRNKLEFPKSVDANVAFLKAWQAGFDGDSFDFDYHLMWDHVNDPGHMQISRTIHQDMRGLRDIGLDGFVSCQIQRIFFPTGLAMAVMGRTLWNTDLDFDEIARDYFSSAFGPDGEASRAYLAKLSELFDPIFLRGEKDGATEEAVGRLTRIPEEIAKFRPVIERNLGSADPCYAKSWLYLKHHAELCEALAQALKAKASGDRPGGASAWQHVRQMAWEKEPVLHAVFDSWLFTSRLDGRFK